MARPQRGSGTPTQRAVPRREGAGAQEVVKSVRPKSQKAVGTSEKKAKASAKANSTVKGKKAPAGSKKGKSAGLEHRVSQVRQLPFPAQLVLVVAIVVGIFLVGHAIKAASDANEVKSGVEYLQTQESKDLNASVASVNKARTNRLKKKMDDGDIDVWSLFGNSMISGDSRAVGFWVYKYLPQSQVPSGAGATIRNIAEYKDQYKAMNPQYLFLCFGLNDSSIGYWNTPEEYAAEYEKILLELRDELPNTKIYVNSILPAQAAGLKREPTWAKIPEFSAAVKAMCEKDGFGYVDCDELAAQHVNLYDVDGVHVQRSFYPLWASCMMSTVLSDEG